MSYSGHNIAPGSSDFVPPTHTELEATAAIQNLQINLAIMPDTLEVPFSELNKHDTWKYQSNSARPSLPPTHTLRTSSPEQKAAPSTEWQGQYAKLLEEFPEEIREALTMNQGLSRNEQYTSLIALNSVLISLSKALVIIESGGEPLLRGSAAENRQRMNEQLPRHADDNYKSSAYEVLADIKSTLEEIGHSHPDHDALHYYSSLSEEGLEALYGEEG
jgi:hypothetical protein